MILARITARNFRNLADTPIEFHPATNLIVGRNGQGKTNLVEAIYFLATTKSFRTTKLANLVRFREQSIYVAGALRRGDVERTISVGIDFGETRRRVLMINEERVTLAQHIAAMTVFAFSSARLDIIRGAPDERRGFLDRGIASLDPGYVDAYKRYARVLRHRNALLQSGTITGLDAWDAEFIATGSELQTARARYTQVIAEAFRKIVHDHGYHLHNVEIQYRPSTADLKSIRREEMRARTSLSGPQRDNVEFTIGGRSAADVASAGEQKMLVLFLKFAKLELFRRKFDEPAIFLLDDVDAELDLEILQKLLSKMPAETQVFATSAKERFLAALETGPHRRLTLENGEVSAVRDFQ
ncbi:MAG TPA: DNA replication and repair protein RecF [Thermoanaerobaculia bacterium]|nr:DNA replication and repair protein RecF [Thermoanaerobaculia bacterium]